MKNLDAKAETALCKKINSLENLSFGYKVGFKDGVAEAENELIEVLHGHPHSQIWGEDGLLAATMRSLAAYSEENDKLRGLISEVIAYYRGEDEYDFTKIPDKKPYITKHDAWQELLTKLEDATA